MAEAFRTSWDKVFNAVEYVVAFGLEHRVLGQIDAIGVDEIHSAERKRLLGWRYAKHGRTRTTAALRTRTSNVRRLSGRRYIRDGNLFR